MPIQIQEINDENGSLECPLCMEPFEVDDINFFPCVCGYQVCRFCWHRIRTDENGLCPACRTSYPENPVEFRPLTESDLQKIRQEKRQKEVQRRQKITDCRRHLAAIRVLQKNLVFVVGLSQRLSDSEVLKRQDYFGKYGRIVKIVVNTNTAYAGSQGPSASAYITYSKMEEALRAIQSVNNIHADGRTLKASLGTTKYCSTYLKNQQCHKQDCMYLHELADEESSFTKEDMQAGKHQELEQRLIEEVARKEVEEPIEPPACTEPVIPTAKSEKPVPNSRGPIVPWPAQQQLNNNVENSWLAGMPQTLEQGTTNIPAQPESKTKEAKSSPKPKQKKQSPRHAIKTLTPTIETTDSSHGSSECSSVNTTPPPTTINIGTQSQTTGLSNNLEGDSQPDTISSESQTQPVLESAVTDLPPTTAKQDDPNITEQCDERYNLVNENFVKPNLPDTDFPSSVLIPPIFDTATVQHEPLSQPLPDAIPIQSTNDWEAAFGFGKLSVPEPTVVPELPEPVADNGDNDFGFDPWVECSKGLADLMEKETAYRSSRPQPFTNKMEFPSQPFPPQFPTPSQNFANTSPERNPTNHFGIKLSGFPSNFSQNLPQQHHPLGSQMHHAFHHKGSGFDANNKANYPPSPTKKLSDWQNGLRALLPSVNINFAMDGGQSTNPTPANNPTHSLHQSEAMHRRMSPRNHFNPTQQLLRSGYEEPASQIPSQSSYFPQTFDRNQSYFHNRVGLGSALSERYNSLAPPPGLSSSSFHNDPAIISSGVKSPPPPPAMKQAPPVEETPHWMRSLQMLVDTDTSANQPTNMPVRTHANPNPSFSTWPSLPNAGAPLGSATQPPPGFQNRLTDNNTIDYAIRQSLLENQS